jgi:hypothetical protein
MGMECQRKEEEEEEKGVNGNLKTLLDVGLVLLQ